MAPLSAPRSSLWGGKGRHARGGSDPNIHPKEPDRLPGSQGMVDPASLSQENALSPDFQETLLGTRYPHVTHTLPTCYPHVTHAPRLPERGCTQRSRTFPANNLSQKPPLLLSLTPACRVHCRCIRPSVHPSVPLCIHLFHPSDCPPIHTPVCPSIPTAICPLFHPSARQAFSGPTMCCYGWC